MGLIPIKKSKEYSMFKEARFVSSKYFRFFYTNNVTSDCQYGITLTKKIGKAVVRNKYKRICKLLIRHYHPLISVKINIVPRKMIVKQRFCMIEKDFCNCINKLLR